MPHVKLVTFYSERFPTLECYPFSLDVLRTTPSLDLSAPVTVFVGENGTGKSTVLKAIARKCRLTIWEDGSGERVEHNPYEEAFHQYIEVEWVNGPLPGSFFSAQNFTHFTKLLDVFASNDPGQLKYFGGKSLLTQSHGQSLMSFFRARYRIPGLFLLDEPEAALSPNSQVELVRLIHAVAGLGHAQFIICTHSPILLACPGATIYSFDACPIAPISYEDTRHFLVYRDFLSDPLGHFTPCNEFGACFPPADGR